MMDPNRFQFHLLRFFATCFIFVHFNSLTAAAPVIFNEAQASTYLEKYGYMAESSSNSAIINHESIMLAIKEFQRFTGLPETGEMDHTTLNMINKPRCGLKDNLGNRRTARKKRYALVGTKWRKTDLTYRISKYPRALKDKQLLDDVIARAFKYWSDVSNLNFVHLEKGHVVIDVRFEVGKHCDSGSFDGTGGTLAHAYFPEFGGDSHFDDDENWTINVDEGTNLLQIAIHEFGHALGLSHSKVKNSVMFPIYLGYEPSFSLHEDDIMGIQSLYGRAGNKPTSPAKPTPDYVHLSPPDLCQDPSIDAAVRTEDGRKYVFKGEYYWEVNNDGLANREGRMISEDWEGLPGNLDAAFTWTNGETFFFKKNVYWKFRNKQMFPGYPLSIAEHWGVPSDIDSAFMWGENGKLYFFKGSQYWGYDQATEPPIASFYPRPISEWKDIPDNIDAVLPWAGEPWADKTYFFKGIGYYRFDNKKLKADDDEDPLYPRPSAFWWFNCETPNSFD